MLTNLMKIYREFPSKFWVLISVYFIDRLGGALIFPFLSLYITTKFNVGMTEVGFIMAIYSGSAFFGNLLGGALTDKFGRKSILIIGLVSSASVSLMMGLVNTWEVFYLLALITGFVSMIGGPAASAMLADLLPMEKRTDGFGILRVAVNLSVTFGPAIGGLLAGISYQLLFVMDFLVSVIAAGIVFKALSETKPEIANDQPDSGLMRSITGYKEVFKDKLFVIFIFLTMITAIIYLQLTTTLSVYLNTAFGTTPQAYGYLLSLNALMVVLFQFPVTLWVKKQKFLWMMALGNLFYAVGVSMYGYVSLYEYFLLAVIIFTIGEMVIAPVIQTLVVNIAPQDMRGRYMAAFTLGRGAASAIGPVAAGIILDNYDPRWIWFGGGIICCLVSGAYLILNRKAGFKYEAISASTGK